MPYLLLAVAALVMLFGVAKVSRTAKPLRGMPWDSCSFGPSSFAAACRFGSCRRALVDFELNHYRRSPCRGHRNHPSKKGPICSARDTYPASHVLLTPVDARSPGTGNSGARRPQPISAMTQRYMHLSPAALDAAIRLLDRPGATAWKRAQPYVETADPDVRIIDKSELNWR